MRPHLTGDVSAVGGVVRDALLGLPPGGELDLLIEGDAVVLAERVGRALGARVVAHTRFGTAVLGLPHGGEIDIVTARTESYAHPGALPDVTPASLPDDLARRDFTVNAMAVGLSGAREGELTDPHGGVADLAARLVRTLRPGAFHEDPSRLVRAARYAARLGFALAPATADEAREAAATLDLGSPRVAEELRRLLDEPDAGTALALLEDLGVPWVAPGAAAGTAALDAAGRHVAAPGLVPWAVRLGAAVRPAAVPGIALPGWARAVAAEVQAGPALAAAVAAADRPSAVDRLLRGAPPATAVAALAAGADAVGTWWEGDRHREPAVRGSDLVREGVAPGPAIGRALEEVRAALLDGRVGGADEQLALALRVARDVA